MGTAMPIKRGLRQATGRLKKNTPKRPTNRQIAKFWTAYDQGQRRRSEKRSQEKGRSFVFHSRNYREPVAVTTTKLGTVREFETPNDMQQFLETVLRLNKTATQQQFQHFEFKPLSILGTDPKRLRLVETAFLGPPMYSVLRYSPAERFNALYGGRIARKLKQHDISIEKFRKQLNAAFSELVQLQKKTPFELHIGNIVVCDINPHTKKPVLAIVDHGHSKHPHNA